MRVLGIDPSLTSTGLVVVEAGRVVRTSRIRCKSTGFQRVADITNQVLSHAEDCDYVGIEGPSMGSKGAAVVQIFGLWGCLTQALWANGQEPYVVVPSARAKYATGKGTSSKDEVLAATVRRYLDADVTGNDVADALLIAAMGARHYGEPLEAALPQPNLTALQGVSWTV